MSPELHRPVAVDRVGPGGLDVTVEAATDELPALAHRMGLPAVLSLTCTFHLHRDPAHRLVARGRLHAEVMQTCVISLEDFPATVDEKFTVNFVPAGEETEDDDPSSPDEISYENGMIDLGEAAAEQLALALDPYPHAPGAELPDSANDPEDHQFAALAALKRLQ
ncbi:MAG TPA: DUF177 domain-containing protein [Acetobacteraceae bacterium]|nr:DUF177 domain-containing protein [Acetobacteraceae bacterium]